MNLDFVRCVLLSSLTTRVRTAAARRWLSSFVIFAAARAPGLFLARDWQTLLLALLSIVLEWLQEVVLHHIDNGTLTPRTGWLAYVALSGVKALLCALLGTEPPTLDNILLSALVDVLSARAERARPSESKP